MRARNTFLRSTKRPRTTFTDTVVAHRLSCSPTCATTSYSQPFTTSRPINLGFKWFRRPRDKFQEQQYQWSALVNQLRGHGEMSSEEAARMVDVVTMQSGQLEWLTIDAIQSTIRIALRSTSIEHIKLVACLYDTCLIKKTDSEIDISTGFMPFATELLSALAVAGKDAEAATLCLDLSQLHGQPLRLWKALLTTYRKSGDLVSFLKVRDFMALHSIYPDVHILNLQLDLLGASQLFEDAQTLYHSMPSKYQVSPNWETRLHVLSMCMSDDPDTPMEGSAALGKKVYDKIRQVDLEDHADEAYQKLLCWLVYSGANIDTILGEIRRMGTDYDVSLNIQQINAMLLTASKARNWLLVERLWKSFERAEVHPTSDTFSLRIAASVIGGDKQYARDIFEASKAAGYANMLDPLALQSLLAAELLKGEIEGDLSLQILALLNKMEPFPIASTSLLFLIPKLIERKEFLILEEILQKSTDRSDWDEARAIRLILDQLPMATEKKAVWNIYVLLKNLFWNDPTYSLALRFEIIQRLVELGEAKMIGQIFSQLLQSDVKPDEQMFISSLQAARELRDFGLIRRIHQSIKMDVNIAQHAAVLNTLMNAYAHIRSSLALDIWEQIVRSGRGPTHASVSIIMDICTFARAPLKGQHIWSTMERRGFVFNDNNYASYVEMLNKCGTVTEAIEMLTENLKDGKDVGPRAVSTLYNTSKRKSDVAQWAQETCPEIWQSLAKNK